MPRKGLGHNPPIIVRVQDKNNEIASSAELGRAVGWAKAKIRDLNRQILRRDPKRTRLPARRYHYAMPGSNISRIEIETSPPRGMWFVRIIGGKRVVGSFIWFPFDDTLIPPAIIRTFLVVPPRPFNPLLTRTEQQLAKASGLGGPYEVSVQPELDAKRIDWKGPLRTEDANGDPLPIPKRDVLTWHGPQNRYGPQKVRSIRNEEFVFKDGSKYLRSPHFGQTRFGNFREFEGLDDPENDSFDPNAQFLWGAVVAAAIQEKDGEQRDVLITHVVELDGGAQGLGAVTWHVWWRPAGVGLATNGIFRDDLVPPDDPNKWHLIASLPAHNIVSPDRWVRQPVWFFNQSGTEASTMIPDNTVGDYPPNLSVIPRISRRGNINVTDPVLNTQGVQPAQFPYFLSMGTISVDAFAETASISIGPRSSGPASGTNQGFQGTCSASGELTVACPDAVQPQPIPQVVTGNITESASGSSNRNYGGGPWTVAVDYKGDTRVTAEISLKSGSGFANTFSYSISNNGTAGTEGSYNQNFTQRSGYTLKAGALEIILSDFDFQRANTDTSVSVTFNAEGPDGIDSGGHPTIDAAQSNLMWLDLRTDLALWAFNTSGDANTSGTSDRWLSGSGSGIGEGPRSNQQRHQVVYSDSAGTLRGRAAIQLIKGGSILAEHSVEANSATSLFVGGTFQGVRFGTENDFPGAPGVPGACPPGEAFTVRVVNPICPPGFNESVPSTPVTAPGPPSLESFCRRDDIEDPSVNNRTAFFDIRREYAIATDGAGNVAMSVKTWNGDPIEFIPVDGRGISLAPPEVSEANPQWLNFITGDDLIDVMNQIEHFERVPDNIIGTPDDIPLNDIDRVTGRAASFFFNGTIFILG